MLLLLMHLPTSLASAVTGALMQPLAQASEEGAGHALDSEAGSYDGGGQLLKQQREPLTPQQLLTVCVAALQHARANCKRWVALSNAPHELLGG